MLEVVEHPAPPERQQIRVIGLAGLVAGDVFTRPVSLAEANRSSRCRLRAAFSTSTTSSGSGSVRLLAFDLGVPETISLPIATRFSTMTDCVRAVWRSG